MYESFDCEVSVKMLRFLLVSVLFVATQGGLVPQMLPPQFMGGRIVGGVDSLIEDFPHQISMLHFGSHRCGGSIVSPTKIVTASHCIRSTITRYITIRTGSTYHASGGTVVQVVRTHEHEYYQIPYRYDNDIALMFLAEALVYGVGIQPIALAPQDFILEGGSEAVTSGWGTLQQGANTIPANLQSVELPIVDLQQCIDAYARANPPAAVTRTMICAGVYETGGRDACQGDSGGPLTADGILHGVVSWGYGCAQPFLPGINARVGHFRDWIDSINN